MASNNWKRYSSNHVSTSNEIRSHSSVLFNERVNTLFLMLDVEIMDAEITPSIKKILKAN